MAQAKEDILKLQESFLSITEKELGDSDGWYTTPTHRGMFSESLTIWLMMVQALYQKSLKGVLSCLREGEADAVLERNTVSKKAQVKQFSSNTGGYSQARNRVEVETIKSVVRAITRAMFARAKRKYAAYYLDGTMLTLQQAPDILRTYPVHRNQKRISLPQMRLVFATDTETGISTNPSFGPSKGSSEQSLSMNVLDQLEKGSLVIGDRNFGVFSVASRCVGSGLSVLVRLTDFRAKKILKQKTLPRKDFEQAVQWQATRHDQLLDDQDARTIEGRVISSTVNRKGFKPLKLIFFTTSDLSSKKLLEIYERRQDIETDIRYLKQTFEADFINVKTTEMLHKELLIRFATYNLVRSVVAEGAIAVGLRPREVSFSTVRMYVFVFGRQLMQEKSRQGRKKIWNQYLTVVRESKHPNRTRKRSEPRAVRRRDQAFPKLYGERITKYLDIPNS